MAIHVFDNTTFKWMHDGKRHLVHIQQDTSPECPRDSQNDLLTVMACWYRRHNLGDDVVGKKNPDEFWQELVRKNVPSGEVLKTVTAGKLTGISVIKYADNQELLDIYETYSLNTVLGKSSPSTKLVYEAVSAGVAEEYLLDDLTISHCQILLRPYLEWLPLYLYDHSGITMRTSSFNDRWDSGQVGFIYILKDRMMQELEGISEENWREQAITFMQAEVKVYDQYLTGDVYGYTYYEEEDGGWKETDAVWGFFGSDILTNGMLDYIGSGLAEAIQSDRYEMGEATVRQVVTKVVNFD